MKTGMLLRCMLLNYERRAQMKPIRKYIFIIILLVFSVLPVSQAQAALIYNLDTCFNGTAPTSTAPWLTVKFENDGTDQVRLTMTSHLNVSTEFFGKVDFNLNPAITPSNLTFTWVSGPKADSIVGTTQNAQKMQGGGNAAFGFDFETSFFNPPAERFDGYDVVVYTITGVGLKETDFDYTNTGSANAHVAAHVQGIPTGEGSGAIKDSSTPVPIPAAIWLFGSGLLGLVGIRRRIARS